MKTEITEIKTKQKILNKLPFSLDSLIGDYYICFPIIDSRVKDVNGMEMMMVDNKSGSEKKPEPIIICKSNKAKDTSHKSLLGFGDLSFSRKFDFILFCELNSYKLSKHELDELKDLECYLVHKDNILFGF